MKELYCSLNIILIFYIVFTSIKKRKIIFGLFVFPFFIFYAVGFILISAFSTGDYWDYLHPNYQKSLLFSLGEGTKAIQALLVMNMSLVIGNIISDTLLRKKYLSLMYNQTKENIFSLKNSAAINPHLHQYVFLFSSIVFLTSFSFILFRFIMLKDLPLMNLLLHGGYARDFTNLWGFNGEAVFLFKSSIIRQFAQILMPLSALLSLSLNKLRPCPLYKYMSFIFVSITTIILIAFLKKTPLILWAFSLMFYAFSLKKELFFKNINTFLLGLFVLFFGVFGMTIIHQMKMPSFLNSSLQYTSLKKETPKFTYKHSDFPKNTETMIFKTQKSKEQLSDDRIKLTSAYNIKSNKNATLHILYTVVTRVFIVEMFWSYLLCENEELLNYYHRYGPIKSYFEKMRGLKKKTIYEEMFSVVAGFEPGALTFGLFFEIYFYFGLFSFLFIFMIVHLLNGLNFIVQNKFDDPVWKPFIIMGSSVFLQMPLKGFISILFTGGGITYLFCIFTFILAKRCYEIFPKEYSNVVSA